LNEPQWTAIWPAGLGDDLPERLWPDGDFPPVTDRVTEDPTARLVTLSFIGAALKRRARLWILLGVVGLIVGVGLVRVLPPSYQATTTLLLKDGPNEDPQVQISSDAALAKSNLVANDVIQQLKLQQSVASFLAAYSVAPPADADEVLIITMSAPTSADAVARGNAVAAAFLKVRNQYAQIQEQQAEVGLNEQVTEAEQNVKLFTDQLNQLTSSGGSQSSLARLQAEQKSAENTLGQVQSDVTGTIVADRAATKAMVQGSAVINSALPAKRSRLKSGGIYIAGGLIGGLGLGIAIVVIGALISNKLRSRDDVAYALGVPVRASVGRLRKRRLTGFGGTAKRERDLRRVVEHLRHAMPGRPAGGAVGLAVVAVDDPQTVAEAVVTLAKSYAAQGEKVVIADLSRHRDAARRLNVNQPGVRQINVDGASLVLAVPDASDMTPIGPLSARTLPVSLGEPSPQVLAAASRADMLLTLVTLDPSFGAEHLATWATDAVPVVTAGRSTAVAIRSTAELLRIGGTRFESAVLVGADRDDETIGTWSTSAG
jgi:capsular polysaccharide biosynthesis protein